MQLYVLLQAAQKEQELSSASQKWTDRQAGLEAQVYLCLSVLGHAHSVIDRLCYGSTTLALSCSEPQNARQLHCGCTVSSGLAWLAEESVCSLKPVAGKCLPIKQMCQLFSRSWHGYACRS